MYIEKGIPIPPVSRKKTEPTDAEVLRSMEIGDSVVLYHERRRSFSDVATYLGYKITTRKISENYIRLWRVS